MVFIDQICLKCLKIFASTFLKVYKMTWSKMEGRFDWIFMFNAVGIHLQGKQQSKLHIFLNYNLPDSLHMCSSDRAAG